MKPLSVTPRTTEKAYAQSLSGTYVFNVPLDANAHEIAVAVQSQFGVTVTDVRVVKQNGKSVRFSRGKNRYPGTTTRRDTKKAYVTLKSGDSIKVFEEPANEGPKGEKK